MMGSEHSDPVPINNGEKHQHHCEGTPSRISLTGLPIMHVEQSRWNRKSLKSGVRFANVDLFSFERSQGFVCVPSQGGSTLGMTLVHSDHHKYSINEYQASRTIDRYTSLLKKHKCGKLSLTPQQLLYLQTYIDRRNVSTIIPSSSNQAQTHEHNTQMLSNLSRSHLDSVQHVSMQNEDDIESEISQLLECYSLQLLTAKKRRILLRRSGVLAIDHTERLNCQLIRKSREACGCSCADGLCLPNRCECALNGIQCQVDRVSFPCACADHNLCQNPEGRVVFDPVRVRAHYLHTRMRLDFEQQQSSQQSMTVCEPVPKRLKLETESEAILGESTLPINEVSTHTDAELIFSTTETGACRDCQNDGYVQSLMRHYVPPEQQDDDDAEEEDGVGEVALNGGFLFANPANVPLILQDSSPLPILSAPSQPADVRINDFEYASAVCQSDSIIISPPHNMQQVVQVRDEDSGLHTPVQDTSSYENPLSCCSSHDLSATPLLPIPQSPVDLCPLDPISSLFTPSSSMRAKESNTVKQSSFPPTQHNDRSLSDFSDCVSNFCDNGSLMENCTYPVHVQPTITSSSPHCPESPNRSTSPYVVEGARA